MLVCGLVVGGVRINFRPSPINVVRDLGIEVECKVRSCMAMLDGLEK